LSSAANLTPRHTPAAADALRDGVLIVVSPTAREAGFKHPVALTAASWAKCVTVPPGVVLQDEAGRLWDMVWMLRWAIDRQQGGGRVVAFALHVRNDNRDCTPPLVQLKAVSGPDDDCNPCLTVMLPDED
jgi:hypothetical protein